MKISQVISQDYKLPPTYVYVIAEIGINHNGDIGIAEQLISMAKHAGCDAVKFQKRDLETVYGGEFLLEKRESPWGTTQGDQKRKLEFGEAEYKHLSEFARKMGLDFSASAWDEKSLVFLDQYNLDFHKVASALATKVDFLEEIASRGIITVLSLGMCSWADADNAVSIFDKHNCPVIPMHCVSTYPAKEAELNLLQISVMKERYSRNVGYSGHEVSVSPSIVAATLGARVIERHITLDRSMYGSDQSASLELSGLERMVGSLRKLPTFFGSELKGISEGEAPVAKKLRYWQ
jgi:N-acetylneuraminate synthase